MTTKNKIIDSLEKKASLGAKVSHVMKVSRKEQHNRRAVDIVVSQVQQHHKLCIQVEINKEIIECGFKESNLYLRCPKRFYKPLYKGYTHIAFYVQRIVI